MTSADGGAGAATARTAVATAAPGAEPYGFTVSSVVGAPPDVVWQHAISMRGVNAELWPLVQMTFPAAFERLDSERVHLGERLFRSWLLLFGAVPIDWDDLRLVALEPPRRFLERSSMASQQTWEHERTLEPVPGGTRVTDRVAFAPRVVALAPVYRRVFELAFRIRHRNLARRFNAPVR